MSNIERDSITQVVMFHIERFIGGLSHLCVWRNSMPQSLLLGLTNKSDIGQAATIALQMMMEAESPLVGGV